MQTTTHVDGAPVGPRDDHPRPATGLVLHGPMSGSGYQRPPCLVRRADGQAIQLTPLVYAVLEAVDGRRTWDEVAAQVAVTVQRPLTGEDVRFLAEQRLRPAGLLLAADGSEPAADRSTPLLGLRFKVAVTGPDATRRLAAPFAPLFHPLIMWPAVVAFVVSSWWVLTQQGVGSAIDEALTNPTLVLALVVATIVSAAFHELGHAAACHRSGARPGTMGAALYLVWPVFYTDVTDSYRLGRAGRLRVDLGGLYFNALFSLAAVTLWWGTRIDVLLLVVPIQLMQMLRQLIPLVRFDGYHILADLIGVPDLFARIRPTVRRLVGRGDGSPAVLKPWAAAVVGLWVLVVVPALLGLVGLMLWNLPAIMRSSLDGLNLHWGFLVEHVGNGDGVRAAVGLVALFTVGIVPLGIVVMIARMAGRTSRGFIAATEDRMAMRLSGGALVLVLVIAIGPAWWPDAPVGRGLVAADGGLAATAMKGEPEGTVVAEQAPARAVAVEPSMVEVARAATARTTLTPAYLAASRRDQPTRTSTPTLAVVRVDDWPFPFPPPDDARPGDNVVVAVNTIDDSALFEMSSSLAWIADGTVVDNTNVAYAAASCTGCATTAVAFQVVISVGRVDVAVPINEAVAVNYGCTDCVTQAVAVQLMVTLEDDPSPELLAQIELIWSQVALIEQELAGQPAAEIHQELTRVRDELVQSIATGRTGTLDEQGNWTENDGGAGAERLHFGRDLVEDGAEVVPHARPVRDATVDLLAEDVMVPHRRLPEEVEPAASTTDDAPDLPVVGLPAANVPADGSPPAEVQPHRRATAPAGPAPVPAGASVDELVVLPEPVAVLPEPATGQAR